MPGFLQKLFGKRTTPPESAAFGASALEEGEELEKEFDFFRETFYFRPNENFWQFLEANGEVRLQEWFQPTMPQPEPKTFVKLANDATRKGIAVWKQTGLQMYLHGNWSQGGGPSRESRDCLSLLAQILGFPITVYFTETEDGEMQKLEFEP